MSNNVVGYNSKYTDPDKLITAQQYLAEKVLERLAQRENVTLPYKFWNSLRWKSKFTAQLRHASILLQNYSVKAILTALRELPFHYSLGNKKVGEACKLAQKNINSKKKEEISGSLVIESGTQSVRLPFTANKSLFKKLKDL